MSEKFEEWALLEIMGHQRYAGMVSEQSIGGASFVRIDVPECGPNHPAFTKLFGAGSIYAITPVKADVALMMAEKLRQAPVNVYDLPDRIRANLNAPKVAGHAASEMYVDDGEMYEDDDDDDSNDL